MYGKHEEVKQWAKGWDAREKRSMCRNDLKSHRKTENE